MPQISTFAEAQTLLRPLYQNARTLYNLDVMRTLMAHVGNPQNKLRIIHIAGTSGKTSTAYYAAALLHAEGYNVGLTVSPHVDTINERLQINGQPLPEAEYCALLGEFMDLVAGSGVTPSYFEVLTALSFWECARRNLDYVVMEVGMGGEMDATNVIDSPNKVCIITDIGLDHTEILGDTLAKIARFKAGIIHPGNKVYMYEQGDDVMDVVRNRIKTVGAARLFTIPDGVTKMYDWLPLFQQRNLGLAVTAVDATLRETEGNSLDPKSIRQAAQIIIPARLERFTLGDKTIILDGSHNQQKMQALLESIKQLYPEQTVAVLASFVSGSDERWQGALNELIPVAQHIIFTSFHSEKDYPKTSVNPNEFVKFCENNDFSQCSVEPDSAQAFAKLFQRPEPVLLITGSFYLMNHIRPLV